MRNSSILRIDWYLVAPILVLVLLSLTTLFSVNTMYFKNQLVFFILGIILFYFFSQVNYHLLTFYATPVYVISLAVLFLLLLLGIESRGAVRWFDILGFRIQFSEIFKPFLIIALASFLSQRNNTSAKTFLLILALLSPIVFFIYRQPDLGNALIYLGTVLLTLILYGFPLLWFGIGLVGVVGIIPFLLRFLHQYQKQRLLTFLHITNDPLGTSYNAIQSVIAVGSGNFFGKGLGQGTQSALRFLPERHTDFIFATLSEMLGWLGASILIAAFIILFWRMYSILQRVDDTFSRIFLFGAFSLLLIQFFVNIGMNIGLVPIVGVTLPFVSYGGSSFLSNAILLGIVSSMSSRMGRKHVLEIK